MNNPLKNSTGANMLRLLVAALIVLAFFGRAAAQTAGGTVISNQASATYSDGTNSYATVSNTVTVTVSNVSGLVITPDGASNPTVVAGQTGVKFSFTVTNTGNFSDQVHFVPGSAHLSGTASASITQVFIDADNNGSFNGGDTDITGTTADSLAIAQNASIYVVVDVSVNGGASAGQTVQVLLGDAGGPPTYDNQPVTPSLNEVRTVSATSVNGQREARGDITVSVENDARLVLTLTAPPGPVALGGDISYSVQLQNTGARPATGVSLTGGSGSFVYIIVPIPLNTAVKAGQTFPAGTLFTTDALTTAPLAASYVSAQPAPASIRRIAFQVGVSLGAGAFSLSFPFDVTVNTGINASNPIWEITDAFGKNYFNNNITDQSGDGLSNQGDSNADFNEPKFGVDLPNGTQGNQQRTTLTAVGAVLIGPSGAPSAVGPTDNNDDYSNKSVNTGISGVAPGGATTALGQLVYVNTVQNTGNADDTFTLDAPTVPAGFTVEISTDGGTNYTTVSGGGSTSLAVAFGASANIHVRITEPAGNTVLTGFDTVIRATSTATPAASNRTIDRLYTGFVRLVKSYTVSNSTGVGGATDPVPGAVITYNIAYENISTSNGDASCVKLTAQNVVITEDGLAAPNNWGTFTTHTGTASDTGSGVVVVVNATTYTDTVASLAPGASAVFSFQRSIN
ncbi:MAG: beta strand repeat-containing protein [Pyrinomonadaceae bacterium]